MSASASQDEQVVLEICDERQNAKKEDEWLVKWEDGSQTWEPRHHLLDEDGTKNIQLVKYELRKELKVEKYACRLFVTIF